MVLILALYIVLVWLLFSKLKLVKWEWTSGVITVLIGASIMAVFLGLFNSLTPGGRFVVVSRVVEVTPNVSGQVVSIPVQLARVGSIGGAQGYPAVIAVPDDYDKTNLRLGMSGSAWAIADNAGPIGTIMSVLVWISSYLAYL